MRRVAESSQCRATRPALDGALAVGGRIGELLVVEDIVEVDAPFAGVETIEADVFKAPVEMSLFTEKWSMR